MTAWRLAGEKRRKHATSCERVVRKISECPRDSLRNNKRRPGTLAHKHRIYGLESSLSPHNRSIPYSLLMAQGYRRWV